MVRLSREAVLVIWDHIIGKYRGSVECCRNNSAILEPYIHRVIICSFIPKTTIDNYPYARLQGMQ